VTLETIWKFE